MEGFRCSLYYKKEVLTIIYFIIIIAIIVFVLIFGVAIIFSLFIAYIGIAELGVVSEFFIFFYRFRITKIERISSHGF